MRAFITHAGALGTMEAVAYGVPMICMPLFIDQFTNAANYAKRKVAITLDIKLLTPKDFESALQEILQNSIYK